MADENPSPGLSSPGETPLPPPPGANGPAPPNPPGGNHIAPGTPPAQIILNPASRPHTRTTEPAKPADEPKDNIREVVETIVFVVVLVLLLKTFLAEAFVIPTGSMATTLLGYHYQVTCAECGYPFAVNASTEADPQEGHPQPVFSCTCPNCAAENVLRRPAPAPGGRLP